MSLPLPPFFDPAAASRVYRVPYQERAAEAREWAAAHGIRPAVEDARRTALLLIDVQNTFCLPEFELFVGGRSGRGAIEDCERIAAFLYRNLDRITQVVATLDTHTAAQIFHPLFWVGPDGAHPAPHTVITLADVEGGRWRVNPALAPAVAPRAGFDVEAWAPALRAPPRRGRQVPARRVALPLDGGRDRPRDGLGRGGGGLLPRDRPSVADAGGDQGAEPPDRELLGPPARGDGGRVRAAPSPRPTARSSSTCCRSTR